MNSVPKIAQTLCWVIDNEKINIIVENKGIMNFLMQKLLKKPKKTTIHLDEIGSFIWQRIDGVKTLEEIAKELENNFGKSVYPLNERIKKYFNTLREYKFITW